MVDIRRLPHGIYQMVKARPSVVRDKPGQQGRSQDWMAFVLSSGAIILLQQQNYRILAQRKGCPVYIIKHNFNHLESDPVMLLQKKKRIELNFQPFRGWDAMANALSCRNIQNFWNSSSGHRKSI